MNEFEQQLYGALEQMDKKLDAESGKTELFDFDRAVFCYFMEHGKPVTAKELAEHAGVSVSKVRKVISASRYKCADTTVNRITSAFAHRTVNAYQPSLSMMREELIDLRKNGKCEN